MKKLLALSLAVLPLMSMAQDDLYFVAKKPKKAAAQQVDLQAKAEKVYQPVKVTQGERAYQPVDYHVSRRSDDEYNRRYVSPGGSLALSADSLDADTASLADGYDGYDYIDDPEADFRYSRRLVRFHSPRVYVAASPYYWDLYYGYGAWDYLYDPYYYDPWRYDYGWGCGWSWGPWSTWYGGIWGYRPLHAWAYWGWGPGWYGPYVGHHVHRNTVPREINSSRGHMSSYDRLRTSAARGGLVSGGRTSAASGRGVYTGTRGAYSGSRSSTLSPRGLSQGTRTVVAGEGTGNTRRDNAANRAAARRGDYYSAPTRTQTYDTRSTTRSESAPTRVTSPTRSTTTTRSSSDYSAPSRSSFGSGGGFGGGSRGGGGGGGRR